MLACDEASFLVSYKHDNRLGVKRWLQLKIHLLTCHLCRKYAHQIDELNGLVGQYKTGAEHETCQHHLSEETGVKMQNVLSKELESN